MNIDQFAEYIDEVRSKKPVWFGLESDPVSTIADIERIENRLLLQLPNEYKEFLLLYGGGYFAFTVIYSGTDGSEWNLIERNEDIGLFKSENFLAISENGLGDYYGYRIENQTCGSRIFFYDHDDRQVRSTQYSNIFVYLIFIGLRR